MVTAWLNQTHYGDNRETMRRMIADDVKVKMCVTSPPYWKQKDYGVTGQLGLEHTMEAYLGNVLEVFMLVHRLLTTDGTLWVNIDDVYNKTGGSGADYALGGRCAGKLKVKGRNVPWLKRKELCGIPWRLAFALQAYGWYWRSENVWYKTNGANTSGKDKPYRSHEPLLQFCKSANPYYDMDATRQMSKTQEKRTERFIYQGKSQRTSTFRPPNPNGPAMRSVLVVPTANYKGNHDAVMHPNIAEFCILSSSQPGDVIFDPFLGSGTTAMVAQKLDRNWIGCDINDNYETLVQARLGI
jgi:DNA modification methylase